MRRRASLLVRIHVRLWSKDLESTKRDCCDFPLAAQRINKSMQKHAEVTSFFGPIKKDSAYSQRAGENIGALLDFLHLQVSVLALT